MRLNLLAWPLVWYGFLSTPALAGITFTPGHYYTSDSSSWIRQADDAGGVGAIRLPITPPDNVRGLGFGPDGLLYATVKRKSGFTVLALDNLGNAHLSYSTKISKSNNLVYGKLAIGGGCIYVAGGDNVSKLTLGDPDSASLIYTNTSGVFDIEILPSGNLLVVSDYDLEEITPNGDLVRGIKLSPKWDYDIVNARAVEYDAAADEIYIWQHGYTDFFDQLIRLNATTGRVIDHRTVDSVYDLHFADNGELMIGPRHFITQLSRVPEPSTAAALICIGLMAARFRRRPQRIWSLLRPGGCELLGPG